MNPSEADNLASSVKEVTRNRIQMHADADQSIKKTTDSTSSINKLQKSGNKNYLIKAGMALLVFPEPIISDVLGTTLIAAGAIQEGIRRQSIFLDDLPKAFKSAMRDLHASKDLI
jgi:hypothetical protein